MTLPATVNSLLVVSPCSAAKNKPIAQLELAASADKPAASGKLQARDLYAGRHHRSVVASVDRLRAEKCQVNVDLRIVSARHGVVSEWERLAPYDLSFAGMSGEEAQRIAENLGIKASIEDEIATHDLTIVMLGHDYLTAAGAPFQGGGFQIYIAPYSFKPRFVSGAIVHCGRREAALMGEAPRTAKAAIFERFVNTAIQHDLRAAAQRLVDGSLMLAQQLEASV